MGLALSAHVKGELAQPEALNPCGALRLRFAAAEEGGDAEIGCRGTRACQAHGRSSWLMLSGGCAGCAVSLVYCG